MISDNSELENITNILRFLEDSSYDFVDLTIVINQDRRLNNLLSNNTEKYFIPIGEHGSQSLICYWQYKDNLTFNELPIVWLDSEGSPNSVFASNIQDFLSLLPYDTGGIYDFINSWQYYNSEPDNYMCPTEKYDISTLEFMMDLCKNNHADYDKFIDWLTHELNLQICTNPAKLVGEAIQNFPNLDDWLKHHNA